ncbi:hypothetical protein BGZ75_002773 [Mortierella antarctica]|nr:hypothetical protein BGZ75_002773 [Mortierella antarctica]
MPEQTDKRRSWWGILTPAERSPHPNANARSSQPDLLADYAMQNGDHNNRMFDANTEPDYAPPAFEGTASESEAGNGSQSLRRVSSKMELFKKSTLPKRGKSKGGSKFATITAWSSSRSTLPGRTTMGSVSSTTVDLNHYEKSSLADLDDAMIFSIVEQPDYIEGERERDVAYTIRAEGTCKIVEITRRISDFLELDEKIRLQFPKSRPALPLLEDRRKSFLVSTRQFFFPRKNTAEKLEAYLRKVASHEPLKSSDIFLDFLAVSQEGDRVDSRDQPSHFQADPCIQESKHGFVLDSRNSSDGPLPGLPAPSQAFAQNEDFNIARRDTVPKVRGNRIRPGLPQIQERKKASIEDYELIKVLGKGCMGKVMLVREYRSKNLFALKAISKEWVILQREIEHTKSERNILANVARISHPFLIKLRHSFQSNAQLFMVLDYYPGGDIATQLTKWHRFDPERCLFYAAEIVLGIEELHRLGIVYRDLKPENILLALDGHIVLTDFGLSKQFPTFSTGGDKTNTFCGTAEYLAPEILRAAEYSYAVDWWSLGTLLYEMLTGITPFWAENHAQMYQRVLEDELEFPPEMDPYAISFIAGLLERDPDHRLGSQGAAYVKDHPYFDLVDWELAIQKKLPCPYIPELLSEEDLSNFDDTFLTMTPRLSPGKHTLSKSIQNCFQGYSYTDKFATTGPRNDSKIRLDQRSRGPSSDAYIDGFDQDAPPTKVEGNGHGHANGQHQAPHRTPWQEMGYQEQSLESDSEEEDFYQYRPMTQLYAPPSAAILGHIETKAQATSPALTPPTTYPEDGRMPVERISTSRIGAAADILRGYSERSSIDTHRHNSTGSSHSSGTIGRRLSRGYI